MTELKELENVTCKTCGAIFNASLKKCPKCLDENKFFDEWQILHWINNVATDYDTRIITYDNENGVSGYAGLVTLDPRSYENQIANINKKFKIGSNFETKKNIRWQITSLDDQTLELTSIKEFTIKCENIKLNKNSRRLMKRHIFARLINNGFYQEAAWIHRSDSIFMVTNGFYELFKV